MVQWKALIRGVGLLAGVAVVLAEAPPSPPANVFPNLSNAGERFRFAIIADPQVSHADNPGSVSVNARATLEQAVNELNAMRVPPVSFTVYLGDLVNVPDQKSWENFIAGMQHDQSQVVLVHGNHDTLYPYTGYRAIQKQLMSIDAMYYSFDVGKWHFIVLPCNLFAVNAEAKAWEDQMLTWLAQDLGRNARRPTIVFHHRHIMPGGLSQLEFYTHRLDMRIKLRDLYLKHGNVKYHFNGHVHNGIQPSVKMAREYGGMKMLTVPTIIAGRPFGEEYPQFEQGMKRGGYYMVVDVDGDQVTLTGRLAGTDAVYEYPSEFTEFTEAEEPRWWRTYPDLPARPALTNGSFEELLHGWLKTHRYIADVQSGYVVEVKDDIAADEDFALYIKTREKGQDWALDEYTEVYQVVSLKQTPRPVVAADYRIEQRPSVGGGWIRAVAFGEGRLKAYFMFRWETDRAEYRADYFPRSFGTMTEGHEVSWLYLNQLGERKQALFFKLPYGPGKWRHLTANLAHLYDEALESPGAFEKLGAEKLMIGLGTFCVNNTIGANSIARFDGVKLTQAQSTTGSNVDGVPITVGQENFTCEFGRGLEDQLVSQRARRAKRTLSPDGNLIFNGDCESPLNNEGAPAGWYHAASGWRVDRINGNHVFHVTGSGNAQHDFRSEGVRSDIEPGKTYRVQWRWRYLIEQGQPTFKLRWFSKQDDFLGQFAIRASGSQDTWSQESWEVVAPPEAAWFDVRVLFERNDHGDIWFDDVVVSQVR